MRRLTNDPVLAERVAFDYRHTDLAPRTRVMLDYAIKITRHSVECTEADIETLRGHDYTDADISDIINTAAIYNFNNRVANASGYIPDRTNHTNFR